MNFDKESKSVFFFFFFFWGGGGGGGWGLGAFYLFTFSFFSFFYLFIFFFVLFFRFIFFLFFNPIPLIPDNNMYAKFEKKSMNKFSSYRSEMVRTDGHRKVYHNTPPLSVAGYKNWLRLQQGHKLTVAICN